MYLWIFKINDLGVSNSWQTVILIGIATKPFDTDQCTHTMGMRGRDIPHYAYIYGSQGQSKKYGKDWRRESGLGFDNDDIVDVHLNLKNNNIRWFVNDKNSGVEYKVKCGVDIQYRLRHAIWLIYQCYIDRF